MANQKFGNVPLPHARLPRWHSTTATRSHGRQRPDWALIVPLPASLTTNRELLFTRFGDTVPLVQCLQSRIVAGRPDADAVIAVAEALHADVKAVLAAHDVRVKVTSVPGTATREDCLSAALAQVDEAVEYVLVHDIRRPLASTDLADRVLDGLRDGNDVVVPALAMVDSVKTVDAAGAVTETVDRSRLRSAQYPRGFHREHLTAMLAGVEATDDFDELTLARRAGVAPAVIDGDPDAFILDIPRDIELADAILGCRLAQQR